MEEKAAPKNNVNLKQFLVYLVTDKEYQISDIITKLRAIRGVVTISIFKATVKYSEEKHLTKLKLKYLMLSSNLKENIKMLKKEFTSIEGVQSVILKIKKDDLIQNGV